MSKIAAGQSAEGEALLKTMAGDVAMVKGVRVEAAYHLASLAADAGRAGIKPHGRGAFRTGRGSREVLSVVGIRRRWLHTGWCGRRCGSRIQARFYLPRSHTTRSILFGTR
jgi:hypothetical protein